MVLVSGVLLIQRRISLMSVWLLTARMMVAMMVMTMLTMTMFMAVMPLAMMDKIRSRCAGRLRWCGISVWVSL